MSIPNHGIDRTALEHTLDRTRDRLLDERNEQGWWTGELSASALSTATAVTALALVDRLQPTDQTGESNSHAELIDAGIVWLCQHQNPDGGWGDTDRSLSNISTTTLVWAAMMAVGVHEADHCRAVLKRTHRWLNQAIDAHEQGRVFPSKMSGDVHAVEDERAIDGQDRLQSCGAFTRRDVSFSNEASPPGDSAIVGRIGPSKDKQSKNDKKDKDQLELPADDDDGQRDPAVVMEPVDMDKLAAAIISRYGKDRTFSVPILTMCVLSGRFGEPSDRQSWRHVIQLPFELAAFPQSWFRRLNLRVVSYALPALIAIGQVRHQQRPTRNPLTRWLRHRARAKTLKLLRKVQPTTGGYLEATPLTSFVVMSLAGMRLFGHRKTAGAAAEQAMDQVLDEGVAFLRQSIRDEDNREDTWDTLGSEIQQQPGGWPIDTNLATWVTTLSINALARGGRLDEILTSAERDCLRDWLLDQQYTQVHPFTNAEPGGWAWTDLAGGVPDADDTSGALLALRHLVQPGDEATKVIESANQRVVDAVKRGARWLVSLQNKDGGIPTFCKGWGRLPFDQSNPDITAHFIRAMQGWLEVLPPQGDDVAKAMSRARRFLDKQRTADGAWLPLWFGNQYRGDEENPIYGTNRVLSAGLMSRSPDVMTSVRYLLNEQCDDGGWGGGGVSSVEETALAVEVLATVLSDDCDGRLRNDKPLSEVITATRRGVDLLIERTHEGTWFEPAPIGFYFAKLWYYEKLYPMILCVAALEAVVGWLRSEKAN